jgi:beta-glucanase (GH16 family)
VFGRKYSTVNARLLISFLVVSISGAVLAAPGTSPPAPQTLKGQTFLTIPGEQWKLLWNDEFSSDALDTTKWSLNLPWKGDDGTNRHHNAQYASVMADEDVQLRGGMLHLTSRRIETPNPKGGSYHFTEGMITTSGKFTTRYGYLEMCAKLPTEAGPGTWPAFWTLSEGWPPEMDILEYWGSDNRIHQGTVTKAPDGKQHWDSYHRSQVSLSGWHTYGMEWGPGYQKYNIDGVVTNTIYGNHIPESQHYILLNSGVESARPPREGTTFPNDFVVDYVRVYARPDVPALLNGGFEDAELKPWDRVNESAAVDYGARTGKRSLRIDGAVSGEKASSYAQQTVQGLKPNTRYVLSGYARTVGGATARLGVKEFGGEETRSPTVQGKPGAYSLITLSFSTGKTATAATVYCQSDGGTTFFDDLKLVETVAR